MKNYDPVEPGMVQTKHLYEGKLLNLTLKADNAARQSLN